MKYHTSQTARPQFPIIPIFCLYQLHTFELNVIYFLYFIVHGSIIENSCSQITRIYLITVHHLKNGHFTFHQE